MSEKNGICALGSCSKCGEEFRTRQDVFRHRCSPKLPGPVAIGDSGWAWPTWREALQDAQSGIDRAYEHRRGVFQAAYDAGLTLRQIADVVDLSPAAIHKTIGKQRAPDALLDEPTGVAGTREGGA